MNSRDSARKKDVLALLSGGGCRSVGHSDMVATMVLRQPTLFRRLIEGLWDEDPIVRMWAADGAEKASLKKLELLRPFKAELLGLLAEAKEQELRWYLAQMVPRLSLRARERVHAAAIFRSYLDDRSSIVKTFAMQGLADLAAADESLLPATIELLSRLTRAGTPAMRARGRKLLARFARP
jgi:hypothetical protein